MTTPAIKSSCKAILVIDDDDLIGRMVSRMLQIKGHAVICEHDREGILNALLHRDFDLIITDIVMPELDGLEVISLARRHQPGAAVIAMSGGGNYITRDMCLQLTSACGAVALLEKPLKVEQLIQAVEQALAERCEVP